MLNNRLFISIAATIFIAVLIVFHCAIPEDPGLEPKTSVNAILRTSDWRQNTLFITDTVGNAIQIGAAINSPKNVDSIRMTIYAGDVPVFDTSFHKLSSGKYDTTWKIICFQTTGNKIIIITSYSLLNLTPISAIVSIIAKAGPAGNSKPSITTIERYTLRPTETCSLPIHIFDSDSGQKLTLTMTGYPEGSEMKNDTLFTWTAPVGSAGIYDIKFTVTDDGNPPMSNTASVHLTVTANAVNHPPNWNIDTLPMALSDTAFTELSLSSLCTAPSGDQVIYSLLPGLPPGDTIIGNKYTYKATPSTAGTYLVSVVGCGPTGACDTFFIKLAIENTATDNTPPKIVLINPVKDTGISADANCTITLICSDASGISSVTAAFGGNTFTGALSNGSYTIAFSGLQPGVYNQIILTVTDASTNANKSSRTVYIKYGSSFTVTYSGNGNTGGTVPVDANAYESGNTVLVKGNTSSLEKTGFTFTGWNTAADGKGTGYAAGATFTMGTANVMLYAQWTSNPTYIVTYNGNGNTGGTVPSDPGSYETGAKVTIKENAGKLVKTGFTFAGWNTAPDGKGTGYAAGATFTMGTVNVTLYAQWTINLYTITFDANGGTGTISPKQVESGNSVTLPDGNGFFKSCSKFNGWATSPSGSPEYKAGETYKIGTEDVTLYAVWIAVSHTITFNANGGTGTMGQQTIECGKSASLTPNVFKKTGSTFDGWSTSMNGNVAYQDNAIFTMGNNDVTLYAKWKILQYQVTFNSQGGGSVTSQVVNYGGYATEPTSTRSGLTLVGWYKEPEGINKWNFATQTITADITLYAKWAVMDADGNTYDTVRIGSQTWMVQNLKTTKFNDGTSIPLITGNDSWAACTGPAYCWYNNSSSNKGSCGALYNAYATLSGKLAPKGWHVPSKADWEQLANYFPASISKFSPVGCGSRDCFDGTFYPLELNSDPSWWTSTPLAEGDIGGGAYIFLIISDLSFWHADSYTASKAGFSVRCVKD